MAGEINVGGIRIGVSLATENLVKGIDGVQKEMRKLGRNLERAGKELTIGLSAPLLALGGLGTKAAIDFQSAFAGVRKTVNATEPEFKVLEAGIRNMAKRLPTTAIEIAKVAENAGQLGIKKENILEFTETLVRLGDSTNITASEASILLAQFANFADLPQDEFDNLGAAIVDLGNNSAALENKIVDMLHAIGAAGSQISLTHGEMVGFAAAVASTGIEAEKGGSAISKTFRDMNSAVLSNSDDLKAYSKIAGTDFKKAFQEDAGSAIVAFVNGLNQIKKSGGDMAAALESVGINELRAVDAWSRLGANAQLLADSLARGNKAFAENQALVDESNKRYQTWASQIAINKNIFNDFAISIGQTLAPIFVNLTSLLASITDGFAGLSPFIKDFVFIVGAAVALAGPVTYLSGAFLTLWGSISAPGLVAIAAIAAVSAAGYTLYNNWQGIIAGLKALWTDFVNFLGRNLTDVGNQLKEFANVGKRMLGQQELQMSVWENRVPNIKATKSVKENKEAFDALKDSIKGVLPEMKEVPKNFEKMGDAAKDSSKKLYELIDIQQTLNDQLLSADLTRSVEELGEGFQNQVIKIEKVQEVLSNLRDAYIKLGLSAEKVDSIIAGVDLIPEAKQEQSGEKVESGFSKIAKSFGISLLDETTELGGALSLQIQNSLAQGITAAFNSGSVEDAIKGMATSLAEGIGSAIGGPILGAFAALATDGVIKAGGSIVKGDKISDRDAIKGSLAFGPAAPLAFAGSQIYNSLISSRDPQDAARGQVESFIENALGENVIFDGFVENFGEAFDQIAGDGKGAFETLGTYLTSLAGVTEDVGAQIGFVLSQNVNGNLNEARMMVQQLGISAQDLETHFVSLGESGAQSWHAVEVALQGVNSLTGEGLVEVGNLRGAYDQLANSAGKGKEPLIALQNLAVEGAEKGLTSIAQLRDAMLASGEFSAEEVNRLYTALGQRNITTLDELKNASTRVLGGVVADLESLGMKWGDFSDSIKGTTQELDGLQDKLNTISREVDIDVNLNYNENNKPDALDLNILPSANGNAFSNGTVQKFATGGIFGSPTLFGYGKNLGMLGEAGPEAVMPLTKINGKLGVMAEPVKGGQGITINIDARGAERGVERNIMQAMTQLEDRVVSRAVQVMSRGY